MKAKEQIRTGSFDWAVVREALRHAIPPKEKKSGKTGLSGKLHDIEISVLLNDVFGGEIIRAHKGRGWRFYNRINDEYVDLAGQEETSSSDESAYTKWPGATSDKSGGYEQNDYTMFFQRFVTALEEVVGLGKYQPA